MTKYLLKHLGKSSRKTKATFYADSDEEVRVLVRKWLSLVAVNIPKEEFLLEVDKVQKPRKHHAK